jgi:hypothetical protein
VVGKDALAVLCLPDPHLRRFGQGLGKQARMCRGEMLDEHERHSRV